MAIDSDTKYGDSIKVIRQSNQNQMRKAFMNSQMLQHKEDKVLKTRFFFFQLQNMISLCEIYD